MHAPKPVVGGSEFRNTSISWGRRPPPKCMRSLPCNRRRSRSVWTRSSTLQVLAAVLGSLALLLHFVASFQLESISASGILTTWTRIRKSVHTCLYHVQTCMYMYTSVCTRHERYVHSMYMYINNIIFTYMYMIFALLMYNVHTYT